MTVGLLNVKSVRLCEIILLQLISVIIEIVEFRSIETDFIVISFKFKYNLNKSKDGFMFGI